MSGGYGSGKTVIANVKLLKLGEMFPRSRWVIARKKFVDLRDTTMKTFFKYCPAIAWEISGRWSQAEKQLTLNNGTEYLFLHLDDGALDSVVNGLEINGFLLDQGEEMSEELFDRLEGRLGRWDQAEIPQFQLDKFGGRPEDWPWRSDGGSLTPPPYALVTCNPDVDLHWLFQRFHPESPFFDAARGTYADGSPKPSYKELGYRMIFMDSEKNKFLSRHNVKTMLAKDDSYVRRYVRGQWGIPEGQIHDIAKASLVEGSFDILNKIRLTCILSRGADHGDTAPTCCLWAGRDRDHNMFVYREYYMPNKLVSDHRKNIVHMSEGERYAANVLDPQCFIKTREKYGGRWSVSDEYMDSRNLPRNTAIPWLPADNNEMGTRNKINELLRIDPEHINPFTGERGAPHLYFIMATTEYPQGCVHVVNQVKSQRRMRLGTLLGKPIFSDERDESMEDHAYDAFRYDVAAGPVPSKEAARQAGPLSWNSRRKAMIKLHRHGLSMLSRMAERQARERGW